MFFTFLLAWLIAAFIIYLWCYIVEVVLDLPVTGQTPCTAHASLKNIIRRVLRDASNMAILKEPQNEAEPPETTTNRTYEDLLATAILNKVIDNYQTDLRRSSSGSTSSKRSDASKRHKSRKHEEERWRTSVNNPDLESTSVSSVEEWCRSDSSCGSKYVDHMSFTIQQSIEEITTSDDEHPNNHYLHKHNLSKNSFRNDKEKDLHHEDWQDNWLFSRKGKGSPNPVPVPMLVPNPSTDFRALIGDRDAEDTTDLSETGSDLEETDSAGDIKTILIDSRTIIGGKNLLENIRTENEEPKGKEEISIMQKTEISMVEEASKDSGVDEDLVSEARNNILIHEAPYAESDSLSSNTEKDMEYTERYASIPRQISKEKKNPMPSPRTSKNSINEEQREELIQENNKKEQVEITKSIDLSDEDEEEDKFEEDTPVAIKGSYSEKEKEKWRNPIALPNNPYSKENLDKRLNSQSNSDNHLFGRDYYIREAKRAAGGRQKFLDPDAIIEDESTTENSGQDFNEDTPQNNDSIFVAIPAIVQEEEEEPEEKLDEITDLESVPSSSRPVSLALSTDSEDIKVYNLETGKVITYKTKDYTKEVIQDSKSPDGTKAAVIANELISPSLPQNTSKFDENQNHSTEASREPIMSISKLNHIIQLSGGDLKSPTKTSISKKEFLMQQISHTEPEIEIEEMSALPVLSAELRDSSKKYLRSLVRNNSRNKSVDVPPVSIQEDDCAKPNDTSAASSIEIEENATHNLIEIETEDTSSPHAYHKSCIDLRHIGGNKAKTQLSIDDSLLTSQYVNGFASSTPNLSDDALYAAEDAKDWKTSDLKELEALPKPSVRDLKKLFDQDKQNNKATLSRSKSNLTTKPEFHAHRQVHSLTARSLSKEYRRDLLPQLQNSTITNDAIIGKPAVQEEKPSITEEEEEELSHIPPCRSTIEFFEKLKK